MAVLSPQEVQAIMEMLDAVQGAESSGKAPPGSYDRALGQIRDEYEWGGGGQSANEGFTGMIGNPEPFGLPGGNDSNFRRKQHMANSMANDAMLREMMGSSRRRTEEDGPDATYALADYPQLGFATDVAKSGIGPTGSMAEIFMSPHEQVDYANQRRDWGYRQEAKFGRGPRRRTKAGDYNRRKYRGRR